MDIQQRLVEFVRRLQAAPPAATSEEALAVVCRLIEQVEEELCPLAREEPPPMRYTGRRYAPKSDQVRRLPDGTLVADTRRHRIYCQRDGAITVEYMPDGTVLLNKEGRKP